MLELVVCFLLFVVMGLYVAWFLDCLCICLYVLNVWVGIDVSCCIWLLDLLWFVLLGCIRLFSF